MFFRAAWLQWCSPVLRLWGNDYINGCAGFPFFQRKILLCFRRNDFWTFWVILILFENETIFLSLGFQRRRLPNLPECYSESYSSHGFFWVASFHFMFYVSFTSQESKLGNLQPLHNFVFAEQVTLFMLNIDLCTVHRIPQIPQLLFPKALGLNNTKCNRLSQGFEVLGKYFIHLPQSGPC